VALVKGVLYAADLYGCAAIPDGPALAQLIKQTVAQAGMVQAGRECWFSFPQAKHGDDYGDSVVTVIVPLTESHVAVHTFPAQEFVAVDFFTCGDPGKARRAVEKLVEVFRPARKRMAAIRRGVD
jgi:S-adenosylmethionine decarboxylase